MITQVDRAVQVLRERMTNAIDIRSQVPLAPYSTLRVGGRAEWLVEIRDLDTLAQAAMICQEIGAPHQVIGSGSNLLVSDKGAPGITIVNLCSKIRFAELLFAETGVWFQDLFLFAAQRGLAGLEFAVGIPGTLGGALVSNAGAYQASIANYLSSVEIVEGGERRWVEPAHLRFSYRNSVLREQPNSGIVLLSAAFELKRGDPKAIYDAAREFQRQRIAKQPPHASAGSFFKNIHDKQLAESLERLPKHLKEAGRVPAGFLIELCGLRGQRIDGACISSRHANFVCNLGGASANDLRALAELAKHKVFEKFGVWLEEEVLYFGDWEPECPTR